MTELPTDLINHQLIESEGNSWLQDYRRSAQRKLAELNFPNKSDERWKYTALRPVFELQYTAAQLQGIDQDVLEDHRLAGTIELVFVNGFFDADLSQLPTDLPKGFTISTVVQALENDSASDVQNILEYESDEDVFSYLNRSSFADGAFVKVAKAAWSETPVHIINYTSSAKSSVNFARHMIYLEEGAIATVIETNISDKSSVSLLNNVVTEIVLQERSNLTYSRLQHQEQNCTDLSSLRARIAGGAKFNSSVFSAGGKLSRHFMDVELNGKHAEADLLGLFATKGDMHADNRGIIRHKVPECTSNQLYKGILDDSSHGVFNGIVNIARDAQQTDASQMSRNLLLSRKSRVDAKPELDVYADDVKAAHGAAVGQLSESELFYLQTRCISREDAIQMLVKGFMHEITERAPEIIQDKLNTIFDGYFDGEDVLTC